MESAAAKLPRSSDEGRPREARRPLSIPDPRLLAPDPCSRLLLSQERVREIRRWRERLLHRSRAHPAHEVELRARLVVGAGGSRPSEGLLADDGARRLVVDVEVARGIAQR